MDPNQTPVSASAVLEPQSNVHYDSNPFSATLWGLAQVITVNPISSLLLVFVVILIVLAAIVILLPLSALLGQLGALSPIVLLLAYIITGPTLVGAFTALYCKSTSNEPIKSMDALKLGLSKALPMLGLLIMTVLIVIVGFALFVIPGLIFLAWFSLSPFVLIEENVGLIEAMKRSKALVKGHVLEMIGTMFAGMVLGSNGALAPAIAVSGFGARYSQLKALKASGAAKPKVHWINYVLPLVMVILIGGYFVFLGTLFANSKNFSKSHPYQNTDLFQDQSGPNSTSN